MDCSESSVVIDCGSGVCKAGFAGDDAPKTVFRPHVGRVQQASYTIQDTKQEHYIGCQSTDIMPQLCVQYPIERGIVKNWDDMEKVWEYIFDDQLRVAPEDYALLLTETMFNPKANREKLAQVMFERFNAPAVHIAQQPMLCVYASGRGSALSVECGDGVTQITPVYEGFSLPNATIQSELAGGDLTDNLVQLLAASGSNFATSAERELVRDIKEAVCYVAEDYGQELHKSESSREAEQAYTLPDGQVITVNSQRFRCAEALFRPSLLGSKSLGLHHAVCSSLMQCDIDCRADLSCNVVLTGGSSMLPGIASRLLSELKTLIPTARHVKVVSPAERSIAAWIGGSILASLSTMDDRWATSDEYDEYGPQILERKRSGH